ncbi:hypothetical protein ACQZ19_13790 [Rahnella variigena]|uniref:hypothetical protein n=1 Tax=Rahnella variigena TaxID=574964 RepID=UPI003D2B9823
MTNSNGNTSAGRNSNRNTRRSSTRQQNSQPTGQRRASAAGANAQNNNPNRNNNPSGNGQGAGNYDDGGQAPYPQRLGNPAVLAHIQKDARDRRWMRLGLFLFCLLFSGLFLGKGLSLSDKVVTGLVSYKGQVTSAVANSIKGDTNKETAFVALTPPESIEHAQKNTDEKSEASNALAKQLVESTNWLSASPLITIIAFTLGVGLTLMLGLMKVLFRVESEIKEKEREQENETMLAALATPVSKVLEELWGFIKSKFSK